MVVIPGYDVSELLTGLYLFLVLREARAVMDWFLGLQDDILGWVVEESGR